MNANYTKEDGDRIYANIKKRFDYLKTVPSKVFGRYILVSAPLKEKITKDEATGVETRELIVDKENCRTGVRRSTARRWEAVDGRKLRKHEVAVL